LEHAEEEFFSHYLPLEPTIWKITHRVKRGRLFYVFRTMTYED
jgi:hypothetical protein